METALKVLAVVIVLLVAMNYKLFWYYSQAWIKPPSLRRPYTFLMRDFYHQHPIMVLFGALYLGYALHNWLAFSTMVAVGIGTVIGHLFWGNKYLPNQQEIPTFNPVGNGKKKV